MGETNDPKFRNFREAYCAYYRCRPEEYQRRAFRRALNPVVFLLGLPIYLFNKPFFAMDFGVIDSLGDARTGSEFEFAMDELQGINRVERSIRRGLLRIRISGPRLSSMWHRLHPYIEPPVPEAPPQDVAVVPQASIGRPQSEGSRPAGGALAPHLVRRLRAATDAVISGTPVDEAVREAGFETEAEFVAALEARGQSHGPSRWLAAQLRLGMRVGELEAELARALAVVAEQQMALARLRHPEAPVSPASR